MEELLARVLDAHGGTEAWQQAGSLTARLSLGGPFWAARGWPDIYAGQIVEIDTHAERISFRPFPGAGRFSEFTTGPERVIIRTDDGRTLESRRDPRDSFPLPFNTRTTAWDAVQVAYFASCAMWNYLTEPFVFTFPGVEATEIEPWDENGETWRRLSVTFPPSIANHNPQQVFYFDADFLQRRMDYSPDVTSHPPIAHYTSGHKSFDGFVFPTQRRVHLHDPSGAANRELTLISVDIDDITITKRS